MRLQVQKHQSSNVCDVVSNAFPASTLQAMQSRQDILENHGLEINAAGEYSNNLASISKFSELRGFPLK